MEVHTLARRAGQAGWSADRARLERSARRRLFISLEALSAERLESEGGTLGWVLPLVKERRAGVEKFRRFLERALEHLGEVSVRDQARWLELTWYLQALGWRRCLTSAGCGKAQGGERRSRDDLRAVT